MNQNQKNASGLAWLLLSLVIFIIDISSKLLIHNNFRLYESINVLPFFSITYAQNIGAAFSILEGQRTFLAAIAIIISSYITYVLYKNGNHKKSESFALALILGGAIGNLFDRLYHGFVIDFLDVSFGSWHYPTFNFADCAICLGIAIYIFITVRFKNRDKSGANDESHSC